MAHQSQIIPVHLVSNSNCTHKLCFSLKISAVGVIDVGGLRLKSKTLTVHVKIYLTNSVKDAVSHGAMPPPRFMQVLHHAVVFVAVDVHKQRSK